MAPYAKKMHLKTYSNEAATAYDNYNSTCCLLIHHHYQGPSINDVKQYFPPNFLSLNLHLPKKGPFVYNYFFNKVLFFRKYYGASERLKLWYKITVSKLFWKTNFEFYCSFSEYCLLIGQKVNKFIIFWRIMQSCKRHSWQKFKIILVRKPERKLYSFHSKNLSKHNFWE